LASRQFSRAPTFARSNSTPLGTLGHGPAQGRGGEVRYPTAEVLGFGTLTGRPDLDLLQLPGQTDGLPLGNRVRRLCLRQTRCRASSKGTEKSEQSRAITGLSPSLASYSKLLFVPLLDHGLPLQPVPKERDLGREARPLADPWP